RRLVEAQGRIDQPNLGKCVKERLLEITPPLRRRRVVRTELQSQRTPWDRRTVFQIGHPVGQPQINIEREWRALECRQCPQVDGYRVLGDFREELLGEHYGAFP